MKTILLSLALATALASCRRHSPTEPPHEHGPEPLAHTQYSNRTELLVEFQPPVAGHWAQFAVHATQLGNEFKPLAQGTITVSLLMGDQGVRQTGQPTSPGLFLLSLKPPRAGIGTLVFDIEGDYQDRIIIDSVTIYADPEEAATSARPRTTATSLHYPKEQAWQVSFAHTRVEAQPFHQVIKTSGEILSAPGDEVMVTASANGTVRWADGNLAAGARVKKGQDMFTLVGNTATDNIESRYKEAKADYEKAKWDYEQATALVDEKIVSEKEYLALKTEFENAQTAFQALSKNYSAGGQRVVSPQPGFVKTIYVTEGQYVVAGTPLASVTQNQRVQLKAEVSQKYLAVLPSVRTAHFKTQHDNRVYKLADVSGKLISYGRSVDAEHPMVPVYFEFDNRADVTPGSLVDVFLLCEPIPQALCVPVGALMEEQGVFYVYLQTGGEHFEKREVVLGGNDGERVQIRSGIAAGERVVTRGAYTLKLATQSGAVPAHGHEH